MPCRPRPPLHQAPPPASAGTQSSPGCGGRPSGGQPRGEEAQTKEGSRGPQLGPMFPETGWALVAPPPAWVWSSVMPWPVGSGRGVQEQPRAPRPCSSLARASSLTRLWPLLVPLNACSPPSLTAPGEPLHQTGSGPPGACRAVGLKAAQGSGCGPGGGGLPEKTAGGTFGLAPAGICRRCGSGQVPAAAQLREDGGGWR